LSFGGVICLALILVCAAIPAHAQSDAEVRQYHQPFELKLDRAIRKNFRSYRRQRPREEFTTESFFPIGWSKEGKFAYYVEPVDEACGCYFAKLLIVDLKTDKVLWSFDYNSEFIEEAKREGRPYTLETLWRAHQKLFSEKLREYEIEPQERPALFSFPIRYQGDRLTANLKTSEQPGLTTEERWYGTIGKAKLHLNSARKGSKTILAHSYERVRPLYVGMIGYLKSPFESRIAVVLVEIIRGYEGPPHTGDVRIVGASLHSGFAGKRKSNNAM